jgi:hypothetical protein
MPTRCAIWARVCTDEQESGNQLGVLRAEAARRGLEVTAEYVLDGLSAWTGAHRGQLREALDDARAGQYDVLLCWALDRLERGGIETTLRVMRQFREDRVQVISLQEQWTGHDGERQDGVAATQRAGTGRPGPPQGTRAAGRAPARGDRPSAAQAVRVLRRAGAPQGRAAGKDERVIITFTCRDHGTGTRT